MFTAPDELRARLGGLSPALLVSEAAKLRPRPGGDIVMHGVKTTAVILARRIQALDVELAVIDTQIGPLVKAAAPDLLNVFGVGIDTAAVLLVTAGDNPATSGMIDGRYRLNSGGDRQANNAIWRIVITRLGQHEPRTIAYMERRLAQGKSKRAIVRCLKRYVAREVFALIAGSTLPVVSTTQPRAA